MFTSSGIKELAASRSKQPNELSRDPHDKQHQQQQQLASEAAAAVAAAAATRAAGPTSTNTTLTGNAGNLRYNPESQSTGDHDSSSPEGEHFLNCFKKSNQNQSKKHRKKKAKLAKQETIDEEDEEEEIDDTGKLRCFCKMVLRLIRLKRIFIPLIIVSYIVATYCLPYVDIRPAIPKPLPNIPFNFRDGPLRPSTASQFKVERLFQRQIQAPESVALDSDGNMYMAIEGGSILYAHLNVSSPIKRSYYHDQHLQSSITSTTMGNLLLQQQQQQQQQQQNSRLVDATTTMTPQLLAAATGSDHSDGQILPDLVKIAELNGIRQLPYDDDGGDDQSKRKARQSGQYKKHGGSWRRECQLDEKIYGKERQHKTATTPTSNEIDATASGGGGSNNQINSDQQQQQQPPVDRSFNTNIVISRCSKPLGVRLNPDESYLYVVDTLTGLYRISLKVPDKPHSTQRLVTRLVDFRRPRSQMLPVHQYDDSPSQGGDTNRRHLNVSLMAVDDLDIDFGSGTRGGDIIYLSLASQNWIAVGYLYDLVEGRPSGAILRYDSGNNQLSIMDPTRVAHVRTSSQDLTNQTSRLYTPFNEDNNQPPQPYYGIGAPKLNEEDVFDDRPLHFPNGMQLTDDKQAILIADTSNKRIIKHYIRGPRRGNSDLWAWTPNFPDNIRRGYDKNRETYWTVGCGENREGKFDLLEWLNGWPRLRKFMLKQFYLVGWLIEQFGSHIYKSNNVRDFGYSIKIGHLLLENMCRGMMVLQYNSYGDIIRSIHNSREFPNDLAYYSQVNEVIDAKNQEHFLYLSSPSYSYVTKISLPVDSFDLPATTTNLVTFR